GDRPRTMRERERTGIAFAAIQLLATHGDPSLFYVSSLCREFRDRVLGVVDVDGVYVPPDFTLTEETLGLEPGSVSLNGDLRVVREHKAAFPGYFMDNADAARRLAALLDEGTVTVGTLGGAIDRLVRCETVLGRDQAQLDELVALAAARDHRRLAEFLTR